MSEWISTHHSCPHCGSSDAASTNDRGWSTCYSCNKRWKAEGQSSMSDEPVSEKSHSFLTGDFQALPKRKLDLETCRKFGYRVGRDAFGKPVQIADYRNASGELVAQKIRGADKTFRVVGEGKDLPLFGMHLWKGKGRRLTVVEGELDALSVAQATGLTWDTVSVPNGAQSAAKAIARNLEFVSGYDQVVFLMDQDEVGQKAALECAAMLRPGQAAIGVLPLKDASDMIVAGRVKELSQALWNARPYRPDGIVNASDVWERINETFETGLPYPWPALTAKTLGQRPGTLVTWTAGSGVGKSTIVAKVAYDALMAGRTVGYVALEESVGVAAQRFISNHLGRPTHLGGVSKEDMRVAFDATAGSGRLWLFDHFGSTDGDNLVAKLRYLTKGCGVDLLVLDHLSIAISGLDDGDERRTIDRLVTQLRSLVEETGATLHMISHLRRSSDATEEGGKVSLSLLRGSHSIAQLSDQVIAVESDLMEQDRTMTVKVLKSRVNGDTGVACHLRYDRETGQLNECADAASSENEF